MPPGGAAWEAGAGSSPLSSLHAAQHHLGLPRWLSGKESSCQAGDMGSIPGSERSSGEGNGNSLQYSCLEIPWTEEPGWVQSMRLQRVRHNWATHTHTHTLINVEKMFSRSTSKMPLTATAFGERSWWGRPFLPSYPFQYNLDFLIIHMNCTFKMLHRDRWTVSLRLFYIYFPLRKERREKEKKQMNLIRAVAQK